MTMDSGGVQQIVSALQIVYDPKSTNDQEEKHKRFRYHQIKRGKSFLGLPIGITRK